MKHIHSTDRIAIPEGVEVDVSKRVVKVKGKYGCLERNFKHIPLEMELDKESRELSVTRWFSTPKQRAAIRTVCSHVKNMITGVTKKYQYKMRLVYNHFPINVNIVNNGTTVEIRNFLGEKRTRAVKLLQGVTIEKSTNVKDELVLTGIDLELVSRSAALIHHSTLVRNKDIRQFLDGIYTSEKGIVDTEA